MASGICRYCWHYNRLGAGCAAGPTVIRPNSSETCRLNPAQFREKPKDTRGWELQSPVVWHLTGQKPKVEKAQVLSKGKAKSKVARDIKTGRFTKK